MSSGSLKVDTGGTTSKPAIAIRDTNTGIYSQASGRLGLITNGSEKVTIDDNIGIAIDPLTQFNNGLKFGGSGSTLDAYEEGTWTPVMFNSTSPSYTSSGTYIKIGKKVTVWFYINCTVGGSASVASYISGLPFNAVAVNGRRGTAVINQNTGNSSSVNYVGGKPGGSTTIILQKYTSTTSYVLANGEWPNAQGNFTVEGQYTYYSIT